MERINLNWRLFIAILVAVQLCVAVGQAQVRTFLLDPTVVDGVRTSIASGSKEYAAALKYLKTEAEKALKVRPVSVMEKKQLPPSGDKHDYMSIGKYWWPNPEKKDGRPYIRRDGEVNPEGKDFPDDGNMGQMFKTVVTLSFASYYLGNESYAQHAVQMLRTWFLDSATCMNPNLNFAQAVPGSNDGRGAGIIDTHQLPVLIDALGLLDASSAFTAEDREGLAKWFREYLRWLRESKNGKQEAKANNNHGTWYDVQVVSVAFFVGDMEFARTVLNASREKRIALQIEPDGTQPKELERTRSFGYSLFNLKALVQLSLLGERAGVDLWHYETTDSRSIRKVLDQLVPYMNGDKPWEGKQIAEVKMGDMYPLLLEASRVYKDGKYADCASKLPDAEKLSRNSMLSLGRR